VTLPASWAALLELFRPVFRRRGTFALFTVLATGMVGQTGRRGVVGMLSGARMADVISFHAACRFFSQAVWDVDRLGLVAARIIVRRLLDDDAPVTVVVDDTLFKRWGRKVHHAFWTHDGAAQGGKKIARGNRWVVAGIVVRLPFCTAPVCLPVVFRLWAGTGSASPVELAGQLLGLVAAEFPGREVHGVGDAAYHGTPLLVAGTTWTTRLPANAALYGLAPPRTGKRGRPALTGATLGKPAELAADAAWEKATVVPVRPRRVGLPGRGALRLVRQFRQHRRPVCSGPGGRLRQALRPGAVHRRYGRHRRRGGGALRGAVVDRAVQRRRQAADGCRTGP
jgi:hypothetical protein